jgi:hypothetical protein
MHILYTRFFLFAVTLCVELLDKYPLNLFTRFSKSNMASDPQSHNLPPTTPHATSF